MNTEAIAELLHARPAGRGRWQARCPAHEDRHPSLTITQGKRGVLLRCWSAGCSVESIVTALGLRMANLFDDAGLSPAERSEAAEAKAMRDEYERRQRAVDRQQRDRIYKLDQVMHGIAARLIRRPDDGKMAELFHLVCDRLHEAEATMPSNHDGPMRQPEPSVIPAAIHAALVELGQNFDAKETVRS